MGKFDCSLHYYRCNMTLSVTIFLGLVLALAVSGKPKTYLVETIDNADIPEEATLNISPSHGDDYSTQTENDAKYGFELLGQEGFKLKPCLTPILQCRRFLELVGQGSPRPGFSCHPCEHTDNDLAVTRCGNGKNRIIGPNLRFSGNNVEALFNDYW